MNRALCAWAAAAGMAAGVGCYSPAPYGAPGYSYPAPGAYPAAPGGSYVVPGGSMPGTLGPSMTAPGTGPTLAPPLDGSAPPATYAPGSGTLGPAVPNYEEPNAGDFESGDGFGNPPDDGFQAPSTNGGSPFYREGASVPRKLDVAASARPMNQDYFAGLDEVQPSQLPSNLAGAGVRPAGFEMKPQVADFGADPSATTRAQSPDDEGFGYDSRKYAWLRGVVDFDPDQKNWHIIYGLPPDPADRYAGSLTLLDEGRLADFQDNDVVLVQGRIDVAAGHDLLGKPLYRVTSAELIGRFE